MGTINGYGRSRMFIFGTIICVIFGGVCLYHLVASVQNVYDSIRAREWPAAEAVVVSSTLTEQQAEDSPSFKAIIVYNYNLAY